MARRRSNTRVVAKTLLIYVEGKTEKAFCLFLKQLFVQRNSGVRITVNAGNGGGPLELIRKLRGKLERRAFNNCIVLMDTDLPWPDDLPGEINKTSIYYVGSNPCIEGLFLKLLNDREYHKLQYSSGKCKRYFHDNYLMENEKYDKRNYSKLFNREMLLEKRQNVPEFARLLRLMGVHRL